MPIITLNPAFSKGEIAPALYARADLDWYRLAVRSMTNFMVPKTGGAKRTPGTVFVDETRYPAKTVRGLPFVYSSSTGDTYTVELGDLYAEFIRAGARVTETAKVITAVSQANPAVVTSVAHGYANGDDVYLAGIVGMTELNGRRFRVANKTADTFELQYTDATNVNSTAFGAYVSGGTAARVYKITTPYVEADLATIGYGQDAGVMTLVHKTYPVRELTRTAHTSWTFALAVFAPKILAPGEGGVGGSVAAGGAGGNSYRYKVTAIDNTTGEESLTGYELTRAITAITQANPAAVTAVAHGYLTGDQVRIRNVGGMTQVNGKSFVITKTGADTFTLDGIDSSGYTAYTAGGVAERPYFRVDSAAAPTPAAPIVVTFRAVANARLYALYREQNGVFGFIGFYELSVVPPVIPATLVFSDIGVAVDTSDTPPVYAAVFAAAGYYPSNVAYHQQARYFSGIPSEPGVIRRSRIGFYSNFTVHEPLLDDDALMLPLSDTEVNAIRHLLPLRRLLVLTGSSEQALEGNSAGTVTPSEVNARTYSHEGSAELRPLIVDNAVLFVHARGNIIREMAYDFGSDSYAGPDRSLPANHLFRKSKVRDWAYSKTPNSIVWIVRTDGVLLGFTCVRSEQIFAWHRHVTDGAVEQIVVIPEGDGLDQGGEDAVYLLVKRTISGQVRRYWERMETGFVDPDAPEDARILHSCLSYDGRHTGATTMTLTGSGWTSDDVLTLTASVGTFASTDTDVDAAGKPYTEYWLTDATGKRIRCQVVGYTNSTIVTVKPHKTVPASLQGAAASSWSTAIRKVGGLWHLEGKALAALGDGFVIANPFIFDATVYTVTNGKVIFAVPHAVIHAGLPYLSDLELLDIQNPQGGSLAGKKKLVRNIAAYVHDTASFWAGSKPPADDDVDPLQGLVENKARRSGEDVELPSRLRTEELDVTIKGEFNTNGRCFLRVVDPLPAEFLSVSPTLTVG